MKPLKDGDLISCKINNTPVDGMYLETNWGSKYILSNVATANGVKMNDEQKRGYKYSWCLDGNVKELRKFGTEWIPSVENYPRRPIGCDPEFFFMEKGKVLSAELVLPKEGLTDGSGKVTIDGVQAEINPTYDTCRETLTNRISRLIRNSSQQLGKGQSICFDPLVPIELTVLDKLSDKAKFFGCTPSFNAYDSDNKMTIEDSSKYPFRPAGGHIHLGHDGDDRMKKVLSDIKTIVPLLDIIVGNTCVLIDRHEGNKERRMCYGRAGEYRTPKHGLEYRTLSNFWLKSYPMVSLVFALSRMATDIMLFSTGKYNFVEMIMSKVNIDDVRRAINENDFDLALKNFSKIKSTLEEIMSDEQPINKKRMKAFLFFVGQVKKNGLNSFFSKDTEKYWVDIANGDVSRGFGWESFLDTTVTNKMKTLK